MINISKSMLYNEMAIQSFTRAIEEKEKELKSLKEQKTQLMIVNQALVTCSQLTKEAAKKLANIRTYTSLSFQTTANDESRANAILAMNVFAAYYFFYEEPEKTYILINQINNYPTTDPLYNVAPVDPKDPIAFPFTNNDIED